MNKKKSMKRDFFMVEEMSGNFIFKPGKYESLIFKKGNMFLVIMYG